MELFRKLIFAAALAGLIGGAFVTVVHQIATVPVILKAEIYEKAGEATASTDSTDTSMANMPGMDHEAGAWEPADGFQRNAFTVLADLLTGIGFALLLVSAFALRGGEINWQTGLY